MRCMNKKVKYFNTFKIDYTLKWNFKYTELNKIHYHDEIYLFLFSFKMGLLENFKLYMWHIISPLVALLVDSCTRIQTSSDLISLASDYFGDGTGPTNGPSMKERWLEKFLIEMSVPLQGDTRRSALSFSFACRYIARDTENYCRHLSINERIKQRIALLKYRIIWVLVDNIELLYRPSLEFTLPVAFLLCEITGFLII